MGLDGPSEKLNRFSDGLFFKIYQKMKLTIVDPGKKIIQN
jgi:hypothetical protein